jgi:hypothetical protein
MEAAGKPLRRVCIEDLRAYQRHLAADRGVGFSAFNQNVSALRFFYRDCLERDWDSRASLSRDIPGCFRRSSAPPRCGRSSRPARTSSTGPSS